MPKRHPGEEVFNDGNREVRLRASFGFLVAVNSLGHDAAALFTQLSNGLTPPTEIRDVLRCAMIDSPDIPDAEHEAYTESLIERYGLQECAAVALIMLTHAMVGDVKKCQMDRREAIRGMLDMVVPSPSTSFRRLGLLWGGLLASSTALTCTIFKLSGVPIW